MPIKLDDTLAVLNGLVGDYLVRTGNALATDLALYHGERPLPATAEALRGVHAAPTGKVVVLLHGVMCTETIWRMPDGTDYGQRLAADLGFTPLYVRYNTGQPIADNGAAFHALLTQLVSVYPTPIDELVLLGYSMGGLVVRSACHRAAEQQAAWLSLVRRAVYVGTPHAGAPAERLGRVATRLLKAIPDPYTRLIADISDLRSAGVKDLGNADLRDEDRVDQRERISLRDARHPVPLLDTMRHYLIAGTLYDEPNLAAWFGDSMVPLASATAARMRDTGESPIRPEDIKVFPGRSHVKLPADAEVYEQIRAWLKET